MPRVGTSAHAAAPVATDDTATIAEGSATTVVNVLANDTDADSDTLHNTAASYSGVYQIPSRRAHSATSRLQTFQGRPT